MFIFQEYTSAAKTRMLLKLNVNTGETWQFRGDEPNFENPRWYKVQEEI